MATIYEHITDVDRALILAPRQAFQRRLSSSIRDYNSIRVGMFWSLTRSTGDNVLPIAESLTGTASRLEQVYFGLKNWFELGATDGTVNKTSPMFDGTVYAGIGFRALGALGVTEVSNNSNVHWQLGAVFSTNCANNAGASINTTLIGATNTTSAMAAPYNALGSTNYARFSTFLVTIGDRGLSSQNITVSNSIYQIGTNRTDVTAEALRSLLGNATYDTATSALAFQSGGVPYDIPDSVYIRLPYYNNRIRIHAIGALKLT